jgi:ABC-type phosphate/phosphonate transport system substrate-binding protein
VVARKQVNESLRDKFGQAFLNLRQGRDDRILTVLRGEKYVRATDDEYDILRRGAADLKLF